MRQSLNRIEQQRVALLHQLASHRPADAARPTKRGNGNRLLHGIKACRFLSVTECHFAATVGAHVRGDSPFLDETGGHQVDYLMLLTLQMLRALQAGNVAVLRELDRDWRGHIRSMRAAYAAWHQQTQPTPLEQFFAMLKAHPTRRDQACTAASGAEALEETAPTGSVTGVSRGD
ncbi:MAG: hypothetical protein BWY76_01253 [bacterium ADurb.Bin429]|nr:MAG: hypothetical protein BWY76_01253 [bacterium ADurb.Bin429]